MLYRKKRRQALINSGKKAPVNRYYRPNNVSSKPSKDVASNKKIKLKKKMTFSDLINMVIFTAIVGMMLFATTMSTNPTVKFKKGSFVYRPEAEYSQVASELMKSSPLKQSKLFFRSYRFEDEMKQKFPEISAIDAIIPLAGRNLSLSIGLSEPLAFVSNGQSSGVINDTGLLIKESNSTSDLLSIRFVAPQNNFETGARLFTSDEVYLLKLLSKELPSVELKTTGKLALGEILFDVANGQLEVKFKDLAFFAKLSTFTNAEEQVGALKASLKYLDSESGLPQKYIDVRVPGRSFVL